VESSCDFKADRNAASRQGKNDHVFSMGKFGKAGGENAAGFKSICKQHREPLFGLRHSPPASDVATLNTHAAVTNRLRF
jgi:hypothetical protein